MRRGWGRVGAASGPKRNPEGRPPLDTLVECVVPAPQGLAEAPHLALGAASGVVGEPEVRPTPRRPPPVGTGAVGRSLWTGDVSDPGPESGGVSGTLTRGPTPAGVSAVTPPTGPTSPRGPPVHPTPTRHQPPPPHAPDTRLGPPGTLTLAQRSTRFLRHVVKEGRSGRVSLPPTVGGGPVTVVAVLERP